MLEQFITPEAGLAVAAIGGWILLAFAVRLLFTGKMCTGRELAEKNAQIEVLNTTNKELQEQNYALVHEWLPTATHVLHALRDAAKESGS